MLDKLREQKATWEEVERPAADGDQVVVDFDGTVDGEADRATVRARTSRWNSGRAGSMLPDFVDALRGATR